MDFTELYALVAGSIFCLLWLVQVISKLLHLMSVTVQLLRRYVIYPHLIRRHTAIGPLTKSRFVLLVVVVGINAFFCAFKVSTTADLEVRIGSVALVNLIPLYLGIHHGFIADLLGLRIQFFRFLHTLAAMICLGQVVAHAIVVRMNSGSSFAEENQLYGWIVSYPLQTEASSDVGVRHLSCLEQ